MVHPVAEFYICLSLIVIFCTVCFVECGKCPREGVPKSLYYDVFGSVTGNYNGFPESYASYISSDYASKHQRTMPQHDKGCHRPDMVCFPSTLYGFQSEPQCLRARNLDINRSVLRCVLPEKSIISDDNISWSDVFQFHLLDVGAITCSLKFREFNCVNLAASVNDIDRIDVSSCRGHLLSKKETFFSVQNIEIQKSPFSDPSSPCVNISPSKLNWGHNYLYHLSVASLRLKNTCNESVLTVYETFSTDSQFYLFNFTEVVLGPGQVSTLTIAYLPNKLGFSSAELILLTSFGGLLIEAKGFAVESPHKLRPLVGFNASYGGWLGKKLSLSNSFDGIIDLEEVTVLLSVFEGSGSLSVDSICRKQNIGDSIRHSFSNGDDRQLKPMVFAVKINEIVDSKKLFQKKYLEGLLLFSGTITQVAFVRYESSKFEYDTFLDMPDVSISCKIEIRLNDSFSPLLEVPCLEIFGICPLRQQKSHSHMIGIDDPSNRARSMSSVEKSSVLTQALVGAEVDEIILDEWKAQDPVNRPYLLDNHEILFPLVLVGEYYAKSITVTNPSDQPIIVQLILNSGETVGSCKSLSQNSFIGNDSTIVSGSGFSISDTTITEAFLHPLGTGSLGPILFHPSNRCEWKSSAFIRSNLSGVEILSLRGFGGTLSLVMFEGSEPVQRLDFYMTLPFPQNTSNLKKISSYCCKPLLKKLFAVNAGDFPIVVERMDVSGRKCGLDGFIVHNCHGFSLDPGESMELGISYQSDFSMPLVQRELELILGVGIFVIPMQASLPLDVLSLCAQSIFWSDIKRFFWAIFLTVVFISLIWYTVIKKGHVKRGVIAGHTDRSMDSETEINPKSDGVKGVTFSSPFPFKSIFIENAGQLEVAGKPTGLMVKTRREKRRRSRKKNTLTEVLSSQSGNSTPTSPLSPVTTLSPPETCSSSLEKMKPHDSFSHENQYQKSLSEPKKTGSRAMLMSSATFPGLNPSSPSRLAIDPYARAPGPKIHSQNAVQSEGNPRVEDDRFTYNIWGNHLSGAHLCRPNTSVTIPFGTIGHSSNSFFIRGPHQTLMTNSQPPSASKFCDDG